LASVGWAVSGHLLRKGDVSPWQARGFDRLLPVAKLLDYVLPVPGMSLIVVGRKPLKAALPAADPAPRILSLKEGRQPERTQVRKAA
jgi:hypothetical protein